MPAMGEFLLAEVAYRRIKEVEEPMEGFLGVYFQSVS